MAENVIDTLQLDIIVNTKQNGQSITTLRNSLEKLYKFLNGVKDQDFSKISNDIAKIGNSLPPLIQAVNSLGGQGTKNLNSLSNVLKKIKELTAGMATQDASSLDKNLVQVSNSLTKFFSSLNSLDETGIKNIKTISSLSTLSSGVNRLDKTIDGLDVEKLKKKFTQMAEAIDPFITKVSSAKESLVALNGVISGSNKITKSTTSGGGVGNKLGKTLNFGSMIAKLYFVRNITKQLGQNLAKVVQYGIDYEETLNLWQVAMKGNTAEARKFITEMNRAYGISEITLMNYQATFKNMLSSLGGINQEVAYGLSETLSQMALDYASLYNTSIESAMTKFQAVLAGQVRPIRSESGYDITQATLYEVYKDIGGTKSVRQLSETEKRLLRILAVYRQMKDTAVGDMEKTITSTANQARYMSETIKDIATWIGVGANQWLKQSNILLRINAYLVALKELAKSFAVSMGYVEESEEKADDPLGDIEQGWEDINNQVDEYKGKLLGFDKFQVLTSADTGDGADISEELLKAMQDYEEILDKAQNIALFGDAEKNIKGAYDILKDWGFEYDEQSKQWLKDGKTVKENIEDIVKSLGGVLFTVGLLINPWLAVLGAIEYCYWTNEDFKESVNEIFGRIKENAKVVLPLLTSIFEKVLPLIEQIALFVLDISESISPFFLAKLEAILKVVETIVEVVRALFQWDWGSLGKNLSNIWTDWKIDDLVNTNNSMKVQPSWKADGGLATKGSLFYAGEAGPELVTKTSGGNSTIMNMLQLQAAVQKGFVGGIKSNEFSQFKKEISYNVESVRHNDLSNNTRIINIFSNYKNSIENKSIKEVFAFAHGGLADKGSLFYAGEAGPELVTQTSGGNSTIMNMKQLEDAVARGFIRGYAATDNGYASEGTTDVYVDGQRLFSILRNVAKRNGFDLIRIGG